MPLFSTSIESQEQAASAGVRTYPNFGETNKSFRIVEKFNRASLNPSGFPAYYTTGGNGTPSVTTSGAQYGGMNFATSAAAGDDVGVVLSGLTFSRGGFLNKLDGTSQLIFDILLQLTTSTSLEGHIALVHNSPSVDTGIVTTEKHMGVYWDASAGPNYMLTSGNGSTQVTTDTGLAIGTNLQRLEIIWNGINSGTLNMYTPTGTATVPNDTVAATQSVSALGLGAVDQNFFLKFFCQTETTAARSCSIFELGVRAE